MSALPGKRAIIIGAGLAGLSAAQALAGHMDEVIVLERDRLPQDASSRLGVPQGRHLHVLISGGLDALRNLFPGIETDLAAAGGIGFDPGMDLINEMPGLDPLPRRPLGLRSYAMSRPLLELVLRRRVEQNGNVTLRDGCRVIEIIGAADGSAVGGVSYETGASTALTLAADIVVDASGRGAFSLDFLKATGREPPQVTAVGVDLTYSTAIYSFSEEDMPEFIGVATFAKEGDKFSGGIVRRENNLWTAILAGRGRLTPTQGEAFLAAAIELETPSLYNVIKKGIRIGDIARYGVAESVWRHFGLLPRLPHGLVPIGDAICRFNPIYGQGMTVAAQEAVILRDLLSRIAEQAVPLENLSGAFLAEAERHLEGPWLMSVIPDLAYPQTRGERPTDLESTVKYQQMLHRLAARDPAIHKLLMEVRHLVKPAYLLREPELVARVQAEMEAA